MTDTTGYTLGRGEHGESERMEVCPHGSPLGWACVGCAHETGKYGTAPAHRADPRRFVLRAVCDHCGSRVWLAETPDAELRDYASGCHNLMFDHWHDSAGFPVSPLDPRVLSLQKPLDTGGDPR